EIDLCDAYSFSNIWSDVFVEGKNVGGLMIELSTRRRFRINGVVRSCTSDRLQIAVTQTYPNCPKYIRRREFFGSLEPGEFKLLGNGQHITQKVEDIIKRSDTAFVASSGPNGMDVSHRGGVAGFIHCIGKNKIMVPDYPGNHMFNTLGNFKVNPFGGMTIIDFSQSFFLQLTGKIELIINQEILHMPSGGEDRYWLMHITDWSIFQLLNDAGWEHLEYSPFNP
ncbi:MAG: pyridoxamine 5'-phosphate oxidase family protein, partial [Gammaproteobacteria bacterium]|nr:pyridoxamine 5'-phosphate oxidase family protein [Gammaproteobacteria bacterium]